MCRHAGLEGGVGVGEAAYPFLACRAAPFIGLEDLTVRWGCSTIGPMGKYGPLAQWLAASGKDVVSMTFDEIADVIGFPLPRSARIYQAFWSNPTVALPLAKSGFRARPRLGEGRIEFVGSAVTGMAISKPPPREGGAVHMKPDLILVGCVKTKLPGRHRARNLYRSDLFLGRHRYAESQGVPWFILSAKYGLLAPDDEVDSYDVTLLELSPNERAEWVRRVLTEIDRRLGLLSGKTVEIHAGFEYREYGLKRGLESRGAKVVIPLEHAGIGQQLAWYRVFVAPCEAFRQESGASPPQDEPPKNARGLAKAITRGFFQGALDLSGRPNAPVPGWASMPECLAVERLVAGGATPADVRIFLTLVSAMDRARDAERLWASATRLFQDTPWPYRPDKALSRPLFELRDVLALSGVSQRHGSDSAAWRLILEALASDKSPQAVRSVVFEGAGDAGELLRAISVTRSSAQPWFPFLSGPKVSVMWVRMLADPGGAQVENIAVLPVAVDVQVRKVTEYLGITQTAGQGLEAVRGEIQQAWQALADAAVGSAALAGTCAALDPALWFFGRWGCTFCERARRRMPISGACTACRYGA